MSFPRWERWGPLAGVLAVVCWIVVMILVAGTPGTDDSDAKITSYYASSSHQSRDLIAFFIFVAGVLFLLGFLAALRSRLADAEGAPGRITALAFGSGIASVALWIVAVSMFTSQSFALEDTDKFVLDPNTYRIINDMGYSVWIAAVIVSAVLVWATSAIALRSGVLPKWFAWLGVLVGILLLLAVFWIPVFIYWGWVLITSLLLVFRRPPARTATAA